MPGTFSPAFFVLGGELRELSLFIDESGSDNLRDRYYPVSYTHLDVYKRQPFCSVKIQIGTVAPEKPEYSN